MPHKHHIIHGCPPRLRACRPFLSQLFRDPIAPTQSGLLIAKANVCQIRCLQEAIFNVKIGTILHDRSAFPKEIDKSRFAKIIQSISDKRTKPRHVKRLLLGRDKGPFPLTFILKTLTKTLRPKLQLQ